MYSIIELQQLIERHLKNIKFNSAPIELYEPIQYILEIGGKRIRPAFVLAAYNLFKKDIESAINPALALEVFHNFTLLHDDIMDKADLRRNQKTVHKKWNENIAILSGDAMAIMAYKWLAKSPAQILPKLLEVFNTTALEVCEGQQLDMNFEKRLDVSVDEYIEMIRLKTSVLIAVAFKMGAISAGASNEDARNLYEFGLNLGLAFQLQDDYLDSYGDVARFGKKIGGDILANKKTYLYTKALELADQGTTLQLHQLINSKDIENQLKIDTVLSIYNKLGVNILLKDKMSFYYGIAIEAIENVNVKKEKIKTLIEYAAKLMHREN